MQHERLPVGMIAQLEELGRQLQEITREHRDASLGVLEQAVLRAVRQLLPELLREVLLASTTEVRFAAHGVKEDCPECGGRGRVQSWRKRSVLTVCGKVALKRPWYQCSQCKHGWSPVDRTLELESRSRLSAGLLEWVVELGATSSFAEGARLLDRLTGIEISPETVRQRTERRGAALEEAQGEATREVLRTQEAVEQLDPVPGQLLVQTDGVMVRFLDGWHEVKMGLLGGYVDGRLEVPSYVAAKESAEEFGPRLLAEAARRGALEVVGWQGASMAGPALAILPKVAVLGDGGPLDLESRR